MTPRSNRRISGTTHGNYYGVLLRTIPPIFAYHPAFAEINFRSGYTTPLLKE